MSPHPDLVAALAEAGVRLTPAQEAVVDCYAALVADRGRSLNLVSAGDLARFYDRHLFDSLVAVPLMKWTGTEVVDVGSGAGLPGIPIAIACPEAHVLLVERTRKRVAFMTYAIRALAIGNAEALWMDVRDLARTRGGFADVVTIRAVAATDEALALADGVLRPDGVVLLWQTEQQRAREPTPPGWRASWRPTPSRDGVCRGIRVCARAG